MKATQHFFISSSGRGFLRRLAAVAAGLVLTSMTAAGALPGLASAATGTGSTAGVGSTAAAGSVSGAAATAVGSAGYSTIQYSDVTPSTPQYASIMLLSALGIANGQGNGIFNPSGDVTRAEFSKLLDIAMGLQAAAQGAGGASQFSDVPAGQWYTGYVNVAAARGVVNGFPDGTFQPNGNVTYAQAVTEIVRALGYEPNVVGPWPSGYMAEASQIPNQANEDTLLTGLNDQLNQPMSRSDVSRLIANALYAVLPSQTTIQQVGANQVRNTSNGPSTLLQRMGYQDATTQTVNGVSTSVLFFPGDTQFGAPVSSNYQDVVTGTIATNSTLTANQLQIGELSETSGISAPEGTTYTLAHTVGLVGGTAVTDLTGEQVSYVTDQNGNVVFMDAVTPPSDVLANGSLGTQLNVVNGALTAPAAQGATTGTALSQISIEPSGATQYQNYNVAMCGGVPCALPVPTYGNYTFYGSNGTNDNVTAVLNPDGHIIALIDNDRTTAYKDVYLSAVSGSTLSFYDGSSTPTSLGIAPGASVTLDGAPSTIAALKPGMVLNIVINGQSQASTIEASDHTVTGTINNVTIQTTGSIYVQVNGQEYQVRQNPDPAVYAENGSVIGGVQDVLNSLVNNSATIAVGVDNDISYINVTNANTVVGMALNNVPGNATAGQYNLDVETGNGGVTAYPVGSGQPQILAGDIVRLTLDPANGTSTLIDYSTNDTATGVEPFFGTVNYPAVITGILGSEIQIQPTGGPEKGHNIDLYLGPTTPVFTGQGGGGYLYSQLSPITASPSNTANIATTAGTTTPTTLQAGYTVSIGADQSGQVQGILYLNGDISSANPNVPASITLENGTTLSVTGGALASSLVDVAAVSAQTATSGQLGTAEVAPLGASTPVSVSVESVNNSDLGSGAGTNGSVFELQSIGQSLVQYSQAECGSAPPQALSVTPAFAGCEPTVPPASPVVPTAPTAGLAFGALTALGNGNPAFTAGSTTFAYGPGTVVLNIPNDAAEPIGSLVPGQQVVVFYENLPQDGTTPFAVFVEVVNTATTSGSAAAGGTSTSGYTVSGVVNPTVLDSVPCAAVICNVYEVTGTVLDGTTPVSGGTVFLSVYGNGDLLSATAGAAGAATSGTSFVSAITGSNGQYVAYIDVPVNGTTAENLAVTFIDPTGTSESPTTAPAAPA